MTRMATDTQRDLDSDRYWSPTIPAGPWTVEDLDDFPEGTGRRYELIDGALLVSAEPSLQHQRVSAVLLRVLQDAAPPELEVLLPVDVRLSPTRQIAPDLTVVHRSDATGRRVSGVPVLVVEVHSPSTRTVDRVLKRSALRDAGVPHVWFVEPDTGLLEVLELDDGDYREVASGSTVRVERPFGVTVTLESSGC